MRVVTTVITGLVLLVGLSLGVYKYVHDSSQTMVGQLEQVETMIQNAKWDGAKVQLEQTKVSWDQTKYWWTILLDHQELDNIDLSMSRLQRYVDTQGLSLSLGELSALKMLVDHISDKEAFNLRNIL
ncbi:MAG: DUF4363 family protein [Desulfitobacteriaceae bacterium]|nr:DUF4363 family protein [Desulfitobacteriaceae bacterium]MDI6880414.1 DUF4363 family protein [Desulfitobacteriaceae bacterium]MDI6914273.1 DUF4363 family protein [Desulfitobacteriaceae bacterium]